MKDELIQKLPDEIKSMIFTEVCRKLRERKFRRTIPYREIENELLADKFHSRKKIKIDEMDNLLFEVKLGYELNKYINVDYKDFLYYQSTTTRFYVNSNDYIQVCGYSRQDKIKYLMCVDCNKNSIILSHKKKAYICKCCKSLY